MNYKFECHSIKEPAVTHRVDVTPLPEIVLAYDARGNPFRAYIAWVDVDGTEAQSCVDARLAENDPTYAYRELVETLRGLDCDPSDAEKANIQECIEGISREARGRVVAHLETAKIALNQHTGDSARDVRYALDRAFAALIEAQAEYAAVARRCAE